jgi:sulfur carrier protein ThiS
MSELLTIRFVGPVRRPGPERTIELEVTEDDTVGELLARLGYDAEEQASLQVLVDGARAKTLDTSIAEARAVEIMIAIGGG